MLVRGWPAARGDELETVFTTLDTNGDGFVRRPRLARVVGSHALCGAIMAMADADGKISPAEFLKLGGVLQDVAALKAAVLEPRRQSRQ